MSSAQLLCVHLWLWQDQQAAQTGYVSVWERIWHYIDYDFKVGKIVLSVSSLVQGAVVLLLAIIVSRYLRSFIERRMAGRKHIDPGIQYTVLRLVHYFFITVGLLFALKTAFGLDLTSIAVVFTALSVGIGFGLQFIAGDLASGFILLFERPVRVGDFITIAGPDGKRTEGRVQSINLRTTVVITNDHITAIVPNSKLVNQELINWSYGERRSRISIPVGVAYDSNVELVTETLLRAADGIEFVLAEPKPSVQFLGFGESALDFRLLVWTTRPRRYAQLKSDINYRIERLFRENRIEIPYPQMEMRVRGGALPLEGIGPQAFDEEDQVEEPEPTAR